MVWVTAGPITKYSMRFSAPTLAARNSPVARPIFICRITVPLGVSICAKFFIARSIRCPARTAQRICSPFSCSGKCTSIASPANLIKFPPDQEMISSIVAKYWFMMAVTRSAPSGPNIARRSESGVKPLTSEKSRLPRRICPLTSPATGRRIFSYTREAGINLDTRYKMERTRSRALNIAPRATVEPFSLRHKSGER